MDVTGTWTSMQSNPALQNPSKKVSTKASCMLCRIGCRTDSGSHISQLLVLPPSHQDDVNALIATLSTSNMELHLNSLTEFHNRYYNSATGEASALWIFNTLNSIALESGKPGVTVTTFAHSWVQSSVIVRIDGATSGPVTILGSHQDSINLEFPALGRAPGADDVRHFGISF